MRTTAISRWRGITPAAASLLLAVLATLLVPRLAVGATIVSSVPDSMATGVSPSAPVVFTFSAPMDTNVTAAQFISSLAPTTLLPTVASWSPDRLTLTCTPSPAFQQNVTIIWSVDGLDLLGAPLDGTTGGMFTTGSGGPSIVSVVPTRMATNVSPTSQVVFNFSSGMDTTATRAQFLDSSAPTTPLPVTSAWSASKLTLTCTPNPAFPAGKTILWTVSGLNTNGATLSGASGTFMTAAGTSLSLTSVTPPDGATNFPPALPVVFVFPASMDTNLTAAQFKDAAAPAVTLPISNSWSLDHASLTCVPLPYFPTNAHVLWSLAGQSAMGVPLPATNGSFYTAASTAIPLAPALVSLGELNEQIDANLFQNTVQEFLVRAGAALTNGATVTSLNGISTNTLENTGWPDRLEFQADAAALPGFATNFAAGSYMFTALAADGPKAGSVNLAATALPSAPRLLGWQTPPHVLFGQDCLLAWDYPQAGAAIDHVQVSVSLGDVTVYASPLPGAPGALTGASNNVVVPAPAFQSPGAAEVRMTAFSYTTLNTNSIPGAALQAARHRTTTFTLRVVDGTTPPPALLTTNLASVPAGEPFLNPLFTAGGVKPLRFELAGGSLPPGLSLDSSGLISGQATAEGAFNSRLRVTDVLGRSSTQSLAIVTAPPPIGSVPRLANARAAAPGQVMLDILAPFAGACEVQRSPDLANWTTQLTTNLTGASTTVTLSTGGNSSFYRVRGPGLVLPPPRPLTVAPVLNPSLTTSAVVDSSGATLNLTNAAGCVYSLVIPPAALSRPESISMTEVASIGGLPLSGGLQAAVSLQPDGLVFDQPARLDITAPAGTDPRLWMGFGARADGSQFALQPAFTTNRTVSLYLWHFTLGGAGSGTAGDAGSQAQNAPDDPMSSLTQQAAAALQACKADPSCAQDPSSINPDLLKIYIQMADQVVIPKLKTAVQDDSVLDDALQGWLKWLKDISLLGLYGGDFFGNGQATELQKRVRQAGSLAAKALKNAMDKACQDCMKHEIFRIYRMLELARISELLGLNYSDAFWSCVKKCLVFEVSLESEMVSSDGSTILSTHTKGKAKLKPALTDSQDPDPVVLLKLILSGSGQWDITDLQHTTPPKCVIQSAPAAGRMNFPWVQIHLYRKRQVWVPGQGPVTSYVFDPDMTMYLSSGLATMPKEKRQMICPPAGPAAVSDIFGQMFHAFHNDEVVIPQPGSPDADVLTGPAFRMTGFTAGGPADVLFSKPYMRTLSETTENTLIELRHTPAQ